MGIKGIKQRSGGFTLVELLVVMAILAVLIALSIAGIGYAMRRSRNIGRRSAVESMVIGLEAYYTEHDEYPEEPEPGTGFAALFGPGEIGSFTLEVYLESLWDSPPNSLYYYKTDDAEQFYTVCVNQELWNETVEQEWVCDGTGVGNSGFPQREEPQSAGCDSCAGVCGEWDGDSWIDCG
jgi:prepilin-type N-terminal cleavage/methylation domain-containing protein